MDPVALQFLAQLDAATDELPRSVQAGLTLCGSDVVPGLCERVTDRQRPLTTRAFAARVLAELQVPEGYRAMAEVIAGGHAVLLPLFGRLLSDGGVPAAEAAMAFAEEPERLPEVRLVLAGLAVRAAGPEWGRERFSRLAVALYPVAPAPALSLMRLVPSPAYRDALAEHPRLAGANPEAAFEVLRAARGGEDEAADRIVDALVGGLEQVFDRTLEAMARGTNEAPPAGQVRDEP